jgi:general secretion pathway protein B
MSYILDALKKSEAQRHAGRIPTVAAPHGALIESPPPSRLRLLVWSVGVLALVLCAGWWVNRYLDRPVQYAAISPAASPAVPTPLPTRENAAAPMADGSTGGSQAIPRLKLAISLPNREQTVALPSGDVAKPVEQAPKVSAAPLPAREAYPPGPTRTAVLSYADLPPAIRQSLPPLVVGGFAAGESEGAMVMVDDKLVREGDEVAPGIRVEKILSDSAEFSYKGYRFRR